MKITVIYKEYTDSLEEKIEIECSDSAVLIEELEDHLLPTLDSFEDGALITYNNKRYTVATLNSFTVQDLIKENPPLPLYITRYLYPEPTEDAQPTVSEEDEKAVPAVNFPNVNGCLMLIGNQFDPDEKTSSQALLAKVKKSDLFRKDALIREASPLRFHPNDLKFKSFSANFFTSTHYIAAEGIESPEVDPSSFTRFAESTLFRQDGTQINLVGRLGIIGEDFSDCTKHPWVKEKTILSRDPVTITKCVVQHPKTLARATLTFYDFPYRETDPVPEEFLPAFMELYAKSEKDYVLWQCRSGSRRSADHALRCLMLDYREDLCIPDLKEKVKRITALIYYLMKHRNIRLFNWQISKNCTFLDKAISYETTLAPEQVKNRKNLPISFQRIQKHVESWLSDPDARIFTNTEDNLFPFEIRTLAKSTPTSHAPQPKAPTVSPPSSVPTAAPTDFSYSKMLEALSIPISGSSPAELGEALKKVQALLAVLSPSFSTSASASTGIAPVFPQDSALTSSLAPQSGEEKETEEGYDQSASAAGPS